MLSPFDLVAILLVLTAAFAWCNHVLIGLPHTIGLLVMGLAASLVLIAVEVSLPRLQLYEGLANLLHRIDFRETFLNGMLAFLLFAGALHVDLSALRNRAVGVAVMATFGVLISTAIVGLGLWLLSDFAGAPVPLSWALVFGALISPTDPIAVLSTLKSVRVPKELDVDMSGESLFNDGIGVVVFTVTLALAIGGHDNVTIFHIAKLFFVDAFGGALFGGLTGYIAYRAMRRIDNYGIEVLISLALVTGTYALAAMLRMSGPLAVVVAGILIGNRGPLDAMSEVTRRYLFGFWQLVDEILNSVLFLLIGLEVLVLRLTSSFTWIIALSVPLALAARWLAVALPVLVLRSWQPFVPGTISVLTWGGLRGGISIALALSLPEIAEKSPLLAATYAVVVFTILVQGLTLQAVAARVTTVP